MSYVIAVASLKGGAGKTTISTNLAASLALRGLRTLLVDLDELGSTSEWVTMGSERDRLDAAVVSEPGQLASALARISRDVIIIDCPPELKSRTIEAVRSADLVISPVRPTPYDVIATRQLVRLVRDERTGDRPRLAFIVSQAVSRTRWASSLHDTLAQIGEDVLDVVIHLRMVWAESGAGMSVLELGDEKAVQELNQLTDEVLKYVEAST